MISAVYNGELRFPPFLETFLETCRDTCSTWLVRLSSITGPYTGSYNLSPWMACTQLAVVRRYE